ncbi:MAG: DNA adenine methylase [Alphaproteobacteria bacterium]|jgi:methylase of polypeptide subunit release factors|nr:DNA adenine methylase [Alphaproteobacteria bacterium]
MSFNFIPFHDVNFDNVLINSVWGNTSSKEEKIHRIHSYPAKFPAFITTEAIKRARLQNGKIKRIGDIFCGCGTVAFEAKKEGLDFWGCDINPVAILIARVKSNTYNVEILKQTYESIKNGFNNKIEPNYESSNTRIQYWFTKSSFEKLTIIKNSIVKNSQEEYQEFFLCAFSNILKKSSRWLNRSIKPQIDPNKKEIDIFKQFDNQVKQMIMAFRELQGDNIDKKNIIEKGDFLTLQNPPKLDMIITSPPYVTSYEYADLHQLSSLWLEYAENWTDLRKGSIGSMYDYNNHNFDNLNEIGSQIVDELNTKDEKRTAKSVAKYYIDMQNVAKKTFKMLKKEGLALFVIGNTEYKNVRIDNAKHLVYSLYEAGFTKFVIEKRNITNKILTPYRDSNGKFTSDKTSRKIYAEEFVIVGKK